MPITSNTNKVRSFSHKIPFLNVKNHEKLKEAFEWGLSMQKSVIISIGIDVQNQMQERSSLMNKI